MSDNIPRHKIEKIFQQIENLREQAHSLSQRQLPPYRDRRQLPWNLSEGPDTDFQHDILFWFQQAGIHGLQSQLCHWAQEKHKETREKQYEQLAREDNAWATFYLAALPPDLISKIISGTIPSHMRDPDFKQSVGEWVNCEGKHGPGVYSIWVTNKVTGMGPSLAELGKIYDAMKRYVDLRDREFISAAKEIDSQYPQPKATDGNYNFKRRYAKRSDDGPFSFGPALEWLAVFKAQYLDIASQLEPQMLERPLGRCFCYIGWAKNLDERSHQHTSHWGEESVIFGLFSAVARYLYGSKFQIERYVIFYAIHKEDAGFLEILAHALASSYTSLGGFNHWRAGGRGDRGAGLDSTEVLSQFNRHKLMIENTRHVERNLKNTLDKLNHTANLLSDGVVESNEASAAAEQDKCLQRVESLAERAKAFKNILLLEDLTNAFEAYEATDNAPET